ncbi:hypothetical protein Fmac_011942 [Flemingia macrophylla]|uniref:Leucine-rich repeat-containing N-terminal plant-type domain-containing protein n=1 Tax=Flemingia macrophylla TaxID=520843 RepID=A0ABD1MNW3_9FABA
MVAASSVNQEERQALPQSGWWNDYRNISNHCEWDGTIPHQEISTLTDLTYLNLSSNHLQGGEAVAAADRGVEDGLVHGLRCCKVVDFEEGGGKEAVIAAAGRGVKDGFGHGLRCHEVVRGEGNGNEEDRCVRIRSGGVGAAELAGGVESGWWNDYRNISNHCHWKGIYCNEAASVIDIFTYDLNIPPSKELRRIQKFNLSAFPNLEYLSLNGMGLTGTIPQQITTLTNLTLLDPSGNRLHGSIPVQLANLTQLNQLSTLFNFNSVCIESIEKFALSIS